jgi:hypothetical protein
MLSGKARPAATTLQVVLATAVDARKPSSTTTRGNAGAKHAGTCRSAAESVAGAV